MPESKKEIQLEIAHVLFLDIIGYSKLSINEQHAGIEELNEIVRQSDQFRKAEGPVLSKIGSFGRQIACSRDAPKE